MKITPDRIVTAPMLDPAPNEPELVPHSLRADHLDLANLNVPLAMFRQSNPGVGEDYTGDWQILDHGNAASFFPSLVFPMRLYLDPVALAIRAIVIVRSRLSYMLDNVTPGTTGTQRDLVRFRPYVKYVDNSITTTLYPGNSNPSSPDPTEGLHVGNRAHNHGGTPRLGADDSTMGDYSRLTEKRHMFCTISFMHPLVVTPNNVFIAPQFQEVGWEVRAGARVARIREFSMDYSLEVL